ncbi:hypothetical protein A8D93_24085 [Burkholderia cenocepacia]|nr:hypothetical protein A8D93_24085 [Burkholderia cenocepacia]
MHFDLTAGVGTLRRTFACRPTDLLTRRPKKKKAPEGAFKMLRLVRETLINSAWRSSLTRPRAL